MLLRGEGGLEALPHVGKRHAILGPLGPGNAGLDRAEVELEEFVENRCGRFVGAEHPLLAGVALDQVDQLAIAPGRLQVAQRLLVDREEGGGGAVLRAHVGERGAIGHREARETGAAELDELVDDAVRAEHLGQRQYEVGRRRAGTQGPGHADAHHHRRRQIGRLPEQRRFRLDPAHAPAEHAQAIDHRGVRVGAEQRVGQRDAPLGIGLYLHHAAQSLEVYLVADSHPRGDHAEVVKCLLGPAQQGVAFAVAFVLALDVAGIGPQRPEGINLHRMVDDEVGLDEGIDPTGILPGALHRRPHGGQVQHRGHAGEVLEEDPRRQVGHFGIGRRPFRPAGESAETGLADAAPISLAH